MGKAFVDVTSSFHSQFLLWMTAPSLPGAPAIVTFTASGSLENCTTSTRCQSRIGAHIADTCTEPNG